MVWGMKDKLKTTLVKVSKRLLHYLSFFSEPKVIAIIVVFLSLSIALTLRLTPSKWGVYLNEFDPYYEYYLATKVIEHSKNSIIDGIIWWFSWWFDSHPRDTLFWAPRGRDLRRSSQPGAAIVSAIIYYFLKVILGLDVDLYTVHAYLPPIAASLASIFAYLLNKEIHSREAGILSAFFIAISWGYIYRTTFGAKHEALAIPALFATFYFFIRAYKKDSLLNAILAGLSLGIIVFSWGAYLYPWNFIALVTFLWILTHPGDTKLAKIYLITNIIGQIFIAVTPRFGPKAAFYSVMATLPMTTNLLATLVLLGKLKPTLQMKSNRTALSILGIGLVIIFLVLWQLGIIASVSFRILAVIIPLWREVGVTTVAEHAIPTWVALFQDYKNLMFFSMFAFFILLPRKDFKMRFMALFWVTSLYAASSMARLTLLYAPAVVSIASIGIVELFTSLFTLYKSRESRYRGKIVSSEAIVLTIIILIILITPYVFQNPSIRHSHQPPLILTSSIPMSDINDYKYVDWISALEWIKTNIPPNTVIATWWDYGYWISVNTLRNTTCDNGTIDSKQIRKIARAFMLDEETALEIFKELGVEYVVVYEPFQPLRPMGGFVEVYFSSAYVGGDLAKSTQMARWIGLDPDKYRTIAYVSFQQGGRIPVIVPADTPEARNATLYRLLFSKTLRRRYFIHEPPPMPAQGGKWPGYDGPVLVIPEPEHFELVYASEPNEWVLIFKVIYTNSTKG